MLVLKDICKSYDIAGGQVHALKDINLAFRRNEFVAVLGPSGCGKTTLLNIIGGLDKYTSGDLLIEDVSTKRYTDRDWDTYRNHSIGFIFQSYHLIPHQTIIQNVELALMIAGVDKAERRQRALDALDKVGLKDRANNRPNQLSGGQAQRVAIARALINDPEIVLADEPTGALDSKTSIQIMDLLKEVSKDRLVIMVTHNPDLAEMYATRIIRLFDGAVVDDSMPFSIEEEVNEENVAKAAAGQPTVDISSLALEESDAHEYNLEGGGSMDVSIVNVPDSATAKKEAKEARKQAAKEAKEAAKTAKRAEKEAKKAAKKGGAEAGAGGTGGAGGTATGEAAAGGTDGGAGGAAGGTGAGGAAGGNIAADTVRRTNKGRKKRSSMSFGMAFGLSLRNLMSKSKRTIMVAVASSIGIIGVSMVLAISAGVTNYISDMEDDMLSGYPISVQETAISYSSLLEAADSSNTKVPIEKLKDNVYIKSVLDNLMSSTSMTTTNIITPEYMSYVQSMPEDYYNTIQFGYDFDMSNYIYTDFELYSSGGKDAPTENVSITGIRGIYYSVLGTQPDYADYASLISTVGTMSELPDNYEYILSQYDIIATDTGKTQKEMTDEELEQIFNDPSTLIVVLSNNTFSDMNMGQYAFMSEYDFMNYAFMEAGQTGYDEEAAYKYINGVPLDILTSKTFTWYPNDVIYGRTEGVMASSYPYYYRAYADGNGPTGYVTMSNAGMTYQIPIPEYDAFDKDEGMDMGVRLVLQKKSGISYGCLSSGMYYTSALTKQTIETSLESEIVQYLNDQASNGGKDYLDSMPFYYNFTYTESDDDGNEVIKTGQSMYYFLSSMSLMSMMTGATGGDASAMMQVSIGALAGTSIPTSMYIYPIDFDYKDYVTDWLDAWNSYCGTGETFTWTDASGQTQSAVLTEGDEITYTDSVGLIISLVDTMISMVTVALICFTALSLVVSTVMVGIITYVSVVERVKEIGILRAMGSSKRNVKWLFNAETFIIGLAAGIVGIALTYLISLIVNLIVGFNVGIYTIAALPWWEALIMVCVSIVLTLISGLIPAASAAKKDPVVALRTE